MKRSILLALPALVLACEATPPAKTPCPSTATTPACEPAAAAPVAATTPPAPSAPEPVTSFDAPPTTTTTTAAPAPTAAPLPAGEWSLVDRETWVAYQADANDWATDVTKSCGAPVATALPLSVSA